MAHLQHRMRLLIGGLLYGAAAVLVLVAYIRDGLTPWQQLSRHPISTLIFWLGLTAVGLVLDRLTRIRLRTFVAALERVERGELLPPPEARTAALVAIRFPGQTVRLWLAFGITLVLVYHQYRTPGGYPAILSDPGLRLEMLNKIVRELLLVVAVATVLFTGTRRILRQAISRLGLRDKLATSRFSTLGRVIGIALMVVVAYLSLFLTEPPGAPRTRLLPIYLALAGMAVGGLYLEGIDLQQGVAAVTGTLRQLAGGRRPNLFRRIPVTGEDEVADLVAAVNALQDRMEAEFAAVERSLQDARSIQMEMLPRDLRPVAGWDLAAALVPAHQVGGDFYDVIDLGGGRLGVAVGDAVGTGLPAALIMASAMSLLRSHAPLHPGPGQALAAMNRLLCSSLPPLTFVTMAYAVIELDTRTVTLACAGHLPPVVGGRELAALPALPLGVDPGAGYPEHTFVLAPRESLLLYSDGLIEAPGWDGRPLGTGLVEETMAAAGTTARATATLDRLLTRLEEQRLGHVPTDDVTALLVVPPAESRHAYPCEMGQELAAGQAAEAFAAEWIGTGRAREVGTAVGEAVLNAIMHGHGLGAAEPVAVTLRAGPGWLEATVADLGAPFALPTAAPDLAAQIDGEAPIGGWGLHLIRSLATTVAVVPQPRGKELRMTFAAGEEGADV